jgi:hypothetical protein
MFCSFIEAKTDDDQPLTKGDFKIFVEMINKRFEAIDKRFEDMQKYMDKRFEDIYWILGIGFPAVIAFSLFLFREIIRRFEKRFEAIDKRFEETQAILLLLVKAHENEIGPEVIDVTLGKKSLTDVAEDLKSEFTKKIEMREKERIKKYLMDNEIILLIAKRLNEINITQQKG